MTEPTMSTRTAFAAVGEFVRRRSAHDLAQLIDVTRTGGGGSEPGDPSAWQDWAASVATVTGGAIQAQGFRRPGPRTFPYEEAEGQLLTLSEAFLAMSEFLWTFAHRDAPADMDDAKELLSPRQDGEPDAIAWRNWIHIVAWVLRGNRVQGNSWTDAFRAALCVRLAAGFRPPASFAVVDPEVGQGGRDGREHWVTLPFGRGVREIDRALAPLLPDLKTVVGTQGAVVDLVVWLDPVGELAGVAMGAASAGSILPLIRDIWVEAEPHRGRDRALTDEIRVRSSVHERSFSSNDADERQRLLAAAIQAVAETTTGDVMEIELIPRSGQAGLVVTRPMLDDIAAAGHGLRLASKG